MIRTALLLLVECTLLDVMIFCSAVGRGRVELVHSFVFIFGRERKEEEKELGREVRR